MSSDSRFPKGQVDIDKLIYRWLESWPEFASNESEWLQLEHRVFDQVKRSGSEPLAFDWLQAPLPDTSCDASLGISSNASDVGMQRLRQLSSTSELNDSSQRSVGEKSMTSLSEFPKKVSLKDYAQRVSIPPAGAPASIPPSKSSAELEEEVVDQDAVTVSRSEVAVRSDVSANSENASIPVSIRSPVTQDSGAFDLRAVMQSASEAQAKDGSSLSHKTSHKTKSVPSSTVTKASTKEAGEKRRVLVWGVVGGAVAIAAAFVIVLWGPAWNQSRANRTVATNQVSERGVLTETTATAEGAEAENQRGLTQEKAVETAHHDIAQQMPDKSLQLQQELSDTSVAMNSASQRMGGARMAKEANHSQKKHEQTETAMAAGSGAGVSSTQSNTQSDTKPGQAQQAEPSTETSNQAQTAGSNEQSLAQAMRSAVGVEAVEKKNESLKEKANDGALPETPSQGAIQGALASVRESARACVVNYDEASRATIVFASNGTVSSVSVSGAAAGKSAAGCIQAALKKARVQPFKRSRFSVSMTVRP